MTTDCTIGPLTLEYLQEAAERMDAEATRRERGIREFERMVREDAIRLPRSKFMDKYFGPITTWYGVDMGAPHES
jgi:hypothetical protein